MGFNFPNTPVVDQVHTEFGITYTFDGEMWVMGLSATAAAPWVLKAGDAMTGNLMLPDPDPTAQLQTTHKKYVDRIVAEMSLYQSAWQVAANVPDLNVPPNAPLNGYTWIAQTVDPAVPEVAAATIPGIGGNTIAALDNIRWNATLQIYEQIRGPVALSQMTIADAAPATAFHGQQWWDSDAGKNYVYYVDPSGDGAWVQTSGGGGSLAQAIPDDAPTDTQIYGRASPTAGAVPVWTPVGAAGGGITDAPADGTPYERQDNAWVAAGAAGGAIPTDAPSDTVQYARQSATVGGAVAWTPVAATAAGPVVVSVADAFPASPVQGQMHFLSTDASLYVWFIDASSVGSWVEVSAV